MNGLVAVFIGGGVGSLCRYALSRGAAKWLGSSFPIGTLLANLLSCLALAFIVNQVLKGEVTDFWKQFLLIGFCGGFSTFSTFSLETVELIRSGNIGFAVANVLISVVVCFGIIYLIAQKTTA